MQKLTVILFLLAASIGYSQATAGEDAKYEYRYLVDMPTAGILQKGYASVSTDVLPNGVLIPRIEVGVFDGISFGISYGGSNIIGSGDIDWYKYPGVNIRARIFDETVEMPAITIGFDSQGKGAYFDTDDRFEIKSPGIFAAVSKNYEFFGYFSIHGEVNWSLEREDGDNDLNIMVGAEKTIGSKFSVIAEFDFANNDNSDRSLGDGAGYLNLGVRWSVGNGFTIGLDLRDMLDNQKLSSAKADRAIYIEFVNSLF